MKILLTKIYGFFYRLDKKNGSLEGYSYETAPYCGHHFSGHDGYWTESRYHEGEGGQTCTNWFFEITLPTEDDRVYITLFPFFPKFKFRVWSNFPKAGKGVIKQTWHIQYHGNWGLGRGRWLKYFCKDTHIRVFYILGMRFTLERNAFFYKKPTK